MREQQVEQAVANTTHSKQ